MTTTTSSTSNATGNAALAALNAGSSSGSTKQLSASEQGDRFLKLLVTQMQNQDPLNPMDNAQITTQMAQISTVSGINQLNDSITGMTGMLAQMQTLEGAALVGKDVLVAGNQLAIGADGVASGGFDLAGAADSVSVSIKNAAGLVVDTINLGATAAGRHSFDWGAKDPAATGLSFTVTARSGTTAVAVTPLVQDRVTSVSNAGGQLNVELRNNGIVKYSDIKAVG